MTELSFPLWKIPGTEMIVLKVEGPSKVTWQTKMWLLVVAVLGILLTTILWECLHLWNWGRKAPEQREEAPGTTIWMEETKFPTKKDILALSVREEIKIERAMTVLPCQGKQEFNYTNTLRCANFTWFHHRFLFHPEFQYPHGLYEVSISSLQSPHGVVVCVVHWFSGVWLRCRYADALTGKKRGQCASK